MNFQIAFYRGCILTSVALVWPFSNIICVSQGNINISHTFKKVVICKILIHLHQMGNVVPCLSSISNWVMRIRCGSEERTNESESHWWRSPSHRKFGHQMAPLASPNQSDLRTLLKTHSGKSKNNATNVHLHLLIQVLWGFIWKCTVGKSQINATSVIMHATIKVLWSHIWTSTVEKIQTRATVVNIPATIQEI